MYQTILLLLVTAFVTIVTTIVTVRVTMTGRVLSQNAVDQFKRKRLRYLATALVPLALVAVVINVGGLIVVLALTVQLTKWAVFGISAYTSLSLLSMVLMVCVIFLYGYAKKYF